RRLQRTSTQASSSGRRAAATRLVVLAAPALLQLLQRSRPVVLHQARKRAVCEQASLVLTARAVIAFVRGVEEALPRRAAVRARLAIAPVHRHSRPERGHFLGEAAGALAIERFAPL